MSNNDVVMESSSNQPNLEIENTKANTIEKKKPGPGKRLVKVKKTRISMIDGYM